MLRTRVIPCLLLKNSGLVKTIQFKNPKYIGDPINAIKIFNEKEVDELIFLDIDASVKKRKPDLKMLARIASECFMPLGYGGGIRSVDDVREIFNLGVEKVIINSLAVEKPVFIRELADIFGSQSIVVSIDVKKNIFGKYKVAIYNGKSLTKLDPVEFASRMEEMGAGELFLNSIDRDGTMKGFDTDLIRKLSNSVKIPIIACGGAGKIDDLGFAIEAGASAVAVGSIFVFFGNNKAVLINYPSREELIKLNAINPESYESKL